MVRFIFRMIYKQGTFIQVDKLTSSNAIRPLTTTFGRNLSISIGEGSCVFKAAKDASARIIYGAKSPNDAYQIKRTNSEQGNVNLT